MSGTAPRLSEPFRLKLHVPRGSSEGFEQWRFGMSPIFAIDVDGEVRRSRFWFESTAYQFAGMSVSQTSSVTALFDRSPQVVARSGIDQIVLTAYLDGGYRFTANGCEAEVKAGDIVILDLSRSCRMAAVNYTSLSVVVPRAALEPLIADIDRLHGLVLAHGAPLNTLLLSHMRTLYAEAPNLANGEGVAAASATEGLIAACLGPSAAGRETGRQATAAVAMQRLRRLIEAHLGDADLGPDFLCQHGGVSRATLYRLFEPFGGAGNYIRQRRLVRAYRMLCDPASSGERIRSVAARCGFNSQAIFSRALRRAYGMSPSDIRAGAGDGGAPAWRSEGSFAELNRWLRGLDTLAH